MKKQKKLAIVVGHTPEQPGAYSRIISRSEYDYNKEVATYLAGMADIYYRPRTGGYRSAMQRLAREINANNYDFVIELHFNAFDQIANMKGHGTEALIWEGNKKSEDLAKKLVNAVCETFGTHNRGVKEISRSEERGYWFLASMKANAIIMEPFFGDEYEAERFANPGKYGHVLRDTLTMYGLCN